MKIEWIKRSSLPDIILARMQRAADFSLCCEGVSLPCFITVRLCSDEEIAAINSAQRGIERSTDVLSFPTVSYPKGKTAGNCAKLLRQEYDEEARACFLGDIVLSVPHIYRQADEFGHSAEREAAYLLVHGICHLFGYDHMEEDEKARMRAIEESILESAGE